MNNLHIFVVSSQDRVLNQKTANSLALLKSHLFTYTWVDSIKQITLPAEKNDFCMILPAGDHMTQSYLDAFVAESHAYECAYQPQFSLLFAKRGKTFYRRNIDITPIMEEVNALLLSPHHARHIIFPTALLQAVITLAPEAESNFFWHLAQYLANRNITLTTLADCISMEYQAIEAIQEKADISKHLYPETTPLFDKAGLLANQNFSDLYGN